MSFRKRSVRPNLNLSKRSVPTTCGQEDNVVGDDTKSSEAPDVGNKNTSTGEETSSNPTLREETSNGKECPSSSQGKRLSKRTKVAPKLTRNKPSTHTNSDAAGDESNCNSSFSSISSEPTTNKEIPNPTGNNEEGTTTGIVNKHNNPLKVDGLMGTSLALGQVNVDVDQNIDVMSVYKILTSKNNEKDKDQLNPPVENEDNVQGILSNKATITRKKTLPKRTKVTPKLTPRSIIKENKDISISTNEVCTVTENLDGPLLSKNIQYGADTVNPQTTCNSLGVKTNDNENCKADLNITEKDTQSMIKSNDKKDDITPKTSRLPKRVKIQPKLKTRTNISSTISHDKEEVGNSMLGPELSDIDKSRTGNEIKNIVESNSNETTCCTISDDEGVTQDTPEHSNSYINSNTAASHDHNHLTDESLHIGDNSNLDLLHTNSNFTSEDCEISNVLGSEKKELKHVRFTSDEAHKLADYNDDSNDSGFLQLTETTSNHVLPDNSESLNCNSLKLDINSENKIGRCDSNDDYDSFSEGEIIGKQLISKNKVFKPNLGTKRRERLSSFSAYSSCDEDDWQHQKKKKKGKAKKKSDIIDECKKTDQKKTPKNIKQKKNRENLEPNTVKVKKKRKRQPKTDGSKQPKHQEERDLSSLTMQELIHYNHPSFKTVELRSKRDADENEHVIEVGNVTPAPCDNKPEVKPTTEEEVMAPQIMINEDGEIVINQESLTISKKVDDSSLKKNVVYEDSLSYGTHLKRKHVVGKRWNIEETLRFYKALSEIGTDFTLMSQAFGRFSRNELKKKFKKEEKVNCDLVDRALSNRLPLNMEMFLRGKEEMKDKVEENDNENLMATDADPLPAKVVSCEVEILLLE